MIIQNKVVEHKVSKRDSSYYDEAIITEPSLNYDDYDEIAVTELTPPPKFFYQFGIVSFSEKKTCGEGSSPGIYTAIYPYIKWILDNYD